MGGLNISIDELKVGEGIREALEAMESEQQVDAGGALGAGERPTQGDSQRLTAGGKYLEDISCLSTRYRCSRSGGSMERARRGIGSGIWPLGVGTEAMRAIASGENDPAWRSDREY